jgi:hypothetical protein
VSYRIDDDFYKRWQMGIVLDSASEGGCFNAKSTEKAKGYIISSSGTLNDHDNDIRAAEF